MLGVWEGEIIPSKWVPERHIWVCARVNIELYVNVLVTV